MTEYKGLVVSFKQPISEERAAAIRTAFALLEGVAAVEPVENTSADWMVEARLKLALYEQVADVFFPERKARRA